MAKTLRSSTKLNKQSKLSGLLGDLPTVTEFQSSKLPLLKECVSRVIHEVDHEKCSYKQFGMLLRF